MRWPLSFKRFACERQAGSMDCGPACLQTIFKARGWSVPTKRRIRELAKTNRRGTSLAGMVKAAKRLGAEAQVVELDEDALVNDALPAIAPVKGHDGLGHFVVVHAVELDAVWIADPAKGVQRLSREEFRERWTERLIIFGPQSPSGVNFHEDERESNGRFFVSLLSTQKSHFLSGAVAVALSTLAVLVSLLMLRHLIDALISQGSGSLVASRVAALIAAVGMCLLCVAIFQSFFEYLKVHAKYCVQAVVAGIYADQLEQLSEPVAWARGQSDLLAVWKADIVNIREASGAAFTSVCHVAKLLLLWAAIAAFSWSLAVLLAIGVLVLICIDAMLKRSLLRVVSEANEITKRAERHLNARATGSRDAKLHLSLAHRLQLTRQTLVESIWASADVAQRKQFAAIPGRAIGAGLRFASLALATFWTTRGEMTFQDVIIVYVLVTMLMQAVEHVATVLVTAPDPSRALQRLRELLAEPTEADSPEQFVLQRVPPAVTFHQVQTEDIGERHGAPRELSLTIPAGETTLIVEPSRRQRASIRDLLIGMNEPARGQVCFDGVDSRDLRIDSLRSAAAYIDNQPFIFEASVFENVALGNPDASMNDVINASQLAGLHAFVNELPNRYEEIVSGRGVPLSKKQRRQIALARAVLKDPTIIVLDASAWANRSLREHEQELLRSHWADKTKAILASTSRLCDENKSFVETRDTATVTTRPTMTAQEEV